MTDPSTSMGGGNGAFPPTRWSVIQDASNPESPTRRASFEELARVYWRPVYVYFRLKWGRGNEEAKDLTQEFFLTLSEKDILENLSASHGRFRSYIMAALDNFARLQHRYESRLKRGGGLVRVPLEDADRIQPAPAASPEQAFMREWACSLLEEALRVMRQEYQKAGNETVFEVFRLHDFEAPHDVDISYDGLAKKFGISVTDVTHYLYRARQKLRETTLKLVGDTVSDRRDAEAELKELFGESTS